MGPLLWDSGIRGSTFPLSRSDWHVLFLLLSMLGVVAVAGAVVVYVAYPHRGEELPVAPRIGQAMRGAVDRAPTVDNVAARR